MVALHKGKSNTFTLMSPSYKEELTKIEEGMSRPPIPTAATFA